MSLVPLKSAVNPALVSPDLLAGDDVGARRTWHQIPCLVGEERRVLLFHRAAPARVQQGLADGRGYRETCESPGIAARAWGCRVPAVCRVTIG